MGANINATGVLIIILLTVFLLVRVGRKPTSLKHIVFGVLVAFVLLVVFSVLTAPLAGAAAYNRQALICCLCLALISIFTNREKSLPAPRRLISCTIVLIIVLGFVLFSQYYYLVDTAMYTGNPAWTKSFYETERQGKLYETREILSKAAETDGTVYPPGWFSELEIKNLIPEDHRKDLLDAKKCLEIQRFWHTPITTLYGVKYASLHMWYPGGMLNDSLDKLEFKEK